MISWLYDTKFPALIPGASASVSFLTTDIFRLEGPITIFNTPSFANASVVGQWAQDATTSSTFSGTVSGSVLSLSAPMPSGRCGKEKSLAASHTTDDVPHWTIFWRLHHKPC